MRAKDMVIAQMIALIVIGKAQLSPANSKPVV
jgi:hypothetical protein